MQYIFRKITIVLEMIIVKLVVNRASLNVVFSKFVLFSKSYLSFNKLAVSSG